MTVPAEFEDVLSAAGELIRTIDAMSASPEGDIERRARKLKSAMDSFTASVGPHGVSRGATGPDPLMEMVINTALLKTAEPAARFDPEPIRVESAPVVFMATLMDAVAPQRCDWTPELYNRVQSIMETNGWQRRTHEKAPRRWLVWSRPVTP